MSNNSCLNNYNSFNLDNVSINNFFNCSNKDNSIRNEVNIIKLKLERLIALNEAYDKTNIINNNFVKPVESNYKVYLKNTVNNFKRIKLNNVYNKKSFNSEVCIFYKKNKIESKEQNVKKEDNYSSKFNNILNLDKNKTTLLLKDNKNNNLLSVKERADQIIKNLDNKFLCLKNKNTKTLKIDKNKINVINKNEMNDNNINNSFILKEEESNNFNSNSSFLLNDKQDSNIGKRNISLSSNIIEDNTNDNKYINIKQTSEIEKLDISKELTRKSSLNISTELKENKTDSNDYNENIKNNNDILHTIRSESKKELNQKLNKKNTSLTSNILMNNNNNNLFVKNKTVTKQICSALNFTIEGIQKNSLNHQFNEAIKQKKKVYFKNDFEIITYKEKHKVTKYIIYDRDGDVLYDSVKHKRPFYNPVVNSSNCSVSKCAVNISKFVTPFSLNASNNISKLKTFNSESNKKRKLCKDSISVKSILSKNKDYKNNINLNQEENVSNITVNNIINQSALQGLQNLIDDCSTYRSENKSSTNIKILETIVNNDEENNKNNTTNLSLYKRKIINNSNINKRSKLNIKNKETNIFNENTNNNSNNINKYNLSEKTLAKLNSNNRKNLVKSFSCNKFLIKQLNLLDEIKQKRQNKLSIEKSKKENAMKQKLNSKIKTRDTTIGFDGLNTKAFK